MESVPPAASAVPRASDRPGTPRQDAPLLPRRFGRYQLFDRIGRGGMADIFLARVPTELGGDRLVVLKQILAPLSSDPTFARMFVEEAKLCAGLRHANVVQVLDLGREDGLLYMAMEYVEGFDLHQLLLRCSKAKVPLPFELAIFIVREVLAALDFAHRATDAGGRRLGIVHRDVSPSNVLMSLEGEVKLCDFGIARAAGTGDDAGGLGASGSDAQRSLRARVVGKSAYMSPEHARGEPLDARADVFAAGILLWELCAGRRLYRGSEDEMLALAKRAEIPPLPDRGLPEAALLQRVLDRALAPDRGARFASAAEMLRALDDYAHAARLFPSQIRFGQFLMDHFGEQFVAERRARERAARALELGPPASLEPIAAPPAFAPPVPARPVSAAARERVTKPIAAPASGQSIADRDTGEIAVHHDDTDPQTVPLPVELRVPPMPPSAESPIIASPGIGSPGAHSQLAQAQLAQAQLAQGPLAQAPSAQTPIAPAPITRPSPAPPPSPAKRRSLPVIAAISVIVMVLIAVALAALR